MDIRRRRRPGRAGVVAVTVGIALLTAACGGGSSGSGGSALGSSSGSSAASASGLAYSRCMRAHGVPNFPDPGAQGGLNAKGIDPNNPVVHAAAQVCQHLLPNGGQISQAQRQQGMAVLLKYAKCMRSHGVPNFPDPSSGSGGTGTKAVGIDTSSPQFQAATRSCQKLLSVGGAQSGSRQVP